jgi:hypothetical protein
MSLEKSHIRKAASAVGLALMALGATSAAKEPKLGVKEVLSKHLASLGSAQVASHPKTRIVEGPVQMKILVGGSASAAGEATLTSEGEKVELSFKFSHPDYAGERMVFDGKDFAVSRANPTSRSGFGEFVYRYNPILKEGLLGGVLSTAWPLLNPEQSGSQLRYEGLKRLDGVLLHRMAYRTRARGGDLKIDLYFEPETFRHVRSIYVLVIHAGLGPSALDSVRAKETRLTLDEKFSEFKTADEGITLPTRWNVQFTTERNSTTLWEWDIVLENVHINRPIDPKSFTPVN